MRKRSKKVRRLFRRFGGWTTIAVLGVVLLWWAAHRMLPPAEAPTEPEAVLVPHDRILILAPHPDDEVLGCAGVIQKALAMHVPVRVVFFTYGDNNEWSFLLFRKHPVVWPSGVRQMGLVRHDEALEAGRRLGVSPRQEIFLGYPDFGTLNIWMTHWGSRVPYRSMLTRVTSVPYDNALRPGAPYKGEEILRDLTMLLRVFHPTKIYVSHPSDYMPDHVALYLFLRVALWDLEREMRPEVYPYLVHHGSWPQPKGFHPEKPLEPPASLAQVIDWEYSPLAPEEITRKRQALRAHRTQYAYSKQYLLSFARSNELFGDFADVVISQADHASVTLTTGGTATTAEGTAHLTERQRAAIVGIESRSIRVDGDDVVLSLIFTRPLAPTLRVTTFLFGYRVDRPFAQMPKVRVQVTGLLHAVFDQRRRLPADEVRVERGLRHLTIRVPRRLLGDPQRLLTGARTYLGTVPLDWISWRAVILPPSN